MKVKLKCLPSFGGRLFGSRWQRHSVIYHICDGWQSSRLCSSPYYQYNKTFEGPAAGLTLSPTQTHPSLDNATVPHRKKMERRKRCNTKNSETVSPSCVLVLRYMWLHYGSMAPFIRGVKPTFTWSAPGRHAELILDRKCVSRRVMYGGATH